MYNTTYLVFSRSQDKWECNLDLSYPLFRPNGLQTTGRWPPKLQQIIVLSSVLSMFMSS